METTINRNVSATDLRNLAFRDLEQSLATIKQGAENLGQNPIVLRMMGAVGVAQNSLKIIAMTQGAEIMALSGPLHGEDDEADFEAGGAIPVEATVADATPAAPNGNGVATNGNGTHDKTETEPKGPASYAVAHAKVKHRCGAHDLGCDRGKISGNSHGRHQQLCAFFQTARLIEAGYQIDTADDYVKAIKKEYGKIPYSTADTMKKELDRKYGSYRKVLLAVKSGLRARKKTSAKK